MIFNLKTHNLKLKSSKYKFLKDLCRCKSKEKEISNKRNICVFLKDISIIFYKIQGIECTWKIFKIILSVEFLQVSPAIPNMICKITNLHCYIFCSGLHLAILHLETYITRGLYGISLLKYTLVDTVAKL